MRRPLTVGPAVSYWLLALAVVLTIGLGLHHLDSRSLWGDEAFSLTLAQEPLGEFWRVVADSQANMSLYYTLLFGWAHLGDSEATVRALSLLAAVLTIPALFAAARRLFGSGIAAFSVLLLSVNLFFLHYAQEARAYSLVLLLTTVATLLFLELQKPDFSRKVEVAYVVVAALAVYAHFFAVFVVAGHLVATALAGRALARPLLRAAAMGVLVTPLLLFVLFRDAGQVSQLTRPSPGDVIDALRLLSGGSKMFVVYAVLACIALVSWLRYRRSWRDWPMLVAVTWAATPIVGAVVISLGKPLFAPRFLIVALPGIVLIVAVGLTRLPRVAAVAGLVLILLFAGYQVVRTLGDPEEDFKAATRYVLENDRAGDTIAFYRPSRRIPFEYYSRTDGQPSRPRSLLPVSAYGSFDLIGDYRHIQLTSADLETIRRAAARTRLWLFMSASENERVEAKQENRARLVAAVDEVASMRERRLFKGLDIRLYEPRSE